MADNRTMAQMLQAPIEGYEDAIVVPPINANNFELKQPLINLVQSNKFTGRQDPHNHLRFFMKLKPEISFLDKGKPPDQFSHGDDLEDKGKKALSSKEAEKESTKSGSDDETTHMPGSMVKSSKKKELKKFDFVTKSGEHVHLTKEHISAQKKIKEEVKVEAARRKGEIRKEELLDLLGLEVVSKYYNDKLQYDKYCDKIMNRRASSKITNCDVLTRKGPITLKVYKEDGTNEIIPNFKASDLHLGEWREDPLDKLNDLANKKRKHADDIHDYFKANKRLTSSVQYEDHLPGTVLNEPVLGMILFNSHHRHDFVTIEDFRDFQNTMLYTVQEIFFRLHQGPWLDDHARTFSSLLLAEIDKRNLKPLKQIRVIEQLRQ
ncbi:hypothetical protein Tco_1109729 [Tanacetum coccineum]|uniref:Reverse transcriptase domain-containing protein n=1 Tax=Tanacetum coccineum TaxID=301880 RepID=A0ABQ5IHY4_9ASTR